jgi:hypothetical protein
MADIIGRGREAFLRQQWAELYSLEVELSADQLARLHKVSEIEFGFPYELLMGPQGQMVYGDLVPQILLPQMASAIFRP